MSITKEQTQIAKTQIYELLLTDPSTREDDMFLYFEYVRKNNITPTEDVMLHPHKYNLVTYKSVERNRRKLQEIDRDSKAYKIQSTKQMEVIRRKLELEYRMEFRKGNVWQ